MKIWFQNRRTKWKKQENISNAEAAEHKLSVEKGNHVQKTVSVGKQMAESSSHGSSHGSSCPLVIKREDSRSSSQLSDDKSSETFMCCDDIKVEQLDKQDIKMENDFPEMSENLPQSDTEPDTHGAKSPELVQKMDSPMEVH